jgi:flagellar motility protein MotE (MotC chaperone)
MSSGPMMTVQEADKLLRRIVNAQNGDELKTIISNNVHVCDGVFFAQLDELVEEYKRRGDDKSAAQLKQVGDYMARLRFMI